jgi:hypothetical protein
LILLIPLTYYSVQFFQQAGENRKINDVVAAEVKKINAELVELKTLRSTEGLDMVITVRTTAPLHFEQVVALQKGIVDGINIPVSLKVNQVFAERLDPLVPPTPTATPTLTPTHTPGPSPTITPSPLPPTATPTATFTSTATLTTTATSTYTSTPALALVVISRLPLLQLYQSPGGPVIGQIRQGQSLTVFNEVKEVGGLIWVKVLDADGRIGWIPEFYLRVVTFTPTP